MQRLQAAGSQQAALNRILNSIQAGDKKYLKKQGSFFTLIRYLVISELQRSFSSAGLSFIVCAEPQRMRIVGHLFNGPEILNE